MSATSRLIAGLSAAALAMTLAACGTDEASGSNSGSGASTNAASAGSAEAAAFIEKIRGEVTWPEPAKLSKPVDLKGKTVWWVPIGDGVPAIHASGIAMRTAVESAGGTLKLCDGKFNPSDIGNCLKSAGDQGADAVVSYFVDYATIPNAFDALAAKNIPILLAGAEKQPSVESKTLAFWDNGALTATMNQYAAAAGIVAAGESPDAIGIILKDTPYTAKATGAMVTKWKELCADCPINTIDHTTANADKLPSAISAALLKNPKANVIISPDDFMVPPILQAVRTSGRSDVKIVSSSGALPNMQNVKAGSQFGDVGLPANYMGWAIAHGLFQLLVGDKVSEPPVALRYFDSTNIGKLALTPEAYQSGEWYGNNAYVAAFKAVWGVS